MNTTNFTIRIATMKDCETIASIHVKAWQETYAGIISKHYLENLSFDERFQLRKKILSEHNPSCIHLVALVNDSVVGFCDAGPAFNPSEQ